MKNTLNHQAEQLKPLRDKALKIHQSGLYDQAEAAYRSILDQHPDDGETWHYLSIICGQAGRYRQAIDCCDKAIEHGYSSPSLYYNKAMALESTEDISGAATAAELGLTLGSDDAALNIDLLQFLLADGQDDRAFLLTKTLAKHDPHNAVIHTELGKIATRLGDSASAKTAFQKAVSLSPQNAYNWLNLALLHHMSGNSADSETATYKAILLMPELYEAYFLLTQISKVTLDSDAGLYIKHFVADPKIKTPYLHFAAARMWAQNDDIEQSFNHYKKGNELVRQTYTYDVSKDVRDMETISNMIPRKLPVAHKNTHSPLVHAYAEPCPIFIVGMPRSGSTLLEQMLANHSKVTTAGEIPWLQKLIRRKMNHCNLKYPTDMLQLSAQDLSDIKSKYLSILQSHSHIQGTSKFIIDKLPANFLYIPLIVKLFPNAPIIVSARVTMETCWSCYTHFFSGPQYFAYDLPELAQYMKAYNKLVGLYEEAGLYNLYTVQYDQLVQNPETHIRSLLNHCALDFEEDCLSPELSQRLVQTASASQIRKAIHEKKQKETDRYKDYIGPLIHYLNEVN